MNSTITFNETTYDFKYRLGIDPSNDAYEVFDIFIDGEQSIYHLEEGFINKKSDDDRIYILYRNGMDAGLSIKNPTSILNLSEVIYIIQSPFKDLISELPENPNNFDETFKDELSENEYYRLQRESKRNYSL